MGSESGCQAWKNSWPRLGVTSVAASPRLDEMGSEHAQEVVVEAAPEEEEDDEEEENPNTHFK